jgi:methionyl-tRNA formyltransferase
MRVLLLANNWGGWQITRWLREQRENIVALVIHPPDNRKFADQIVAAADLPAERVLHAGQLREAETLERLRALEPDIGVSAFFGYILRPEVFRIPRLGCLNTHPALLPRNRGWHPNVWPFLDGSPAGVSIHHIDAGVDSGDIIVQRRVAIRPTDTGGTLHQRLTRELVDLFREAWPAIRAGTAPRTPQDPSLATTHRKADIAACDAIELDRTYTARELLALLRGRTYAPYPSAYFEENGQRVYVRVQLLTEAEVNERGTPQWEENSPPEETRPDSP